MLLFIVAWIPVCAVVFLWFAGFFTAWEGKVVSVRKNEPEQAVYRVLIAPSEGDRFETLWPRLAVTGLDVKVDARAIPALPLSDTLPTTIKPRFSLGFSVTDAQSGTREIPTTTPASVGIAILLFVIGIGGRNMMFAGSPLSLEKRGVTLPTAQVPHGQVAPRKGNPSTKSSKGRKGPPPGKPRRGSGRRR